MITGGDVPRKIEHIEQLRGFAACAVLGFHSLPHCDFSAISPWFHPVYHIFTHGWLGVHVFFPISGWCIAQRIASAYQRSESPLGYLFDRAARIYPVYWSALAIAVALLGIASPFNGVPLSTTISRTPNQWLADIFLLQPPLGREGFLLVSWTLFYELSFYAAGAAAIWLRYRRVSSCAMLIIGGFLCPLLSWGPPAGVLVGFGFWPHFFAGVIAWWFVNRRLYLVWWGAVVAYLGSVYLEFSADAVVACVTACCLAGLVRFPLRLSAPLGNLFSILGEASYSIYLIHVPLLAPYFNLVARITTPRSLSYAWLWLGGIVLAIAGGLVLHRSVERPFERWRRSFSKRLRTYDLEVIGKSIIRRIGFRGA